jgi:3-methyladenine DNA glycosylase/8-oxoguanine DNA glycosylase
MVQLVWSDYMYIPSKESINYLRQFEELNDIINIVGNIAEPTIDQPFEALVFSIIGQLISNKAAFTIMKRFKKTIGQVEPKSLLKHSFEEIQAIGLTRRKTETIFDIANHFVDGRLPTDFTKYSDQEVLAKLIDIKGIGVWTAEMFLIFCLKRDDVISYGDLLIRKGLMNINKLNTLSKSDFEHFRKRYAPYNTTASLYIWAFMEGNY